MIPDHSTTFSSVKGSQRPNDTSNLLGEITKTIGLSEPALVAMVSIAVLIFFIIVIVLCSKCSCKRCREENRIRDKYKERKLEVNEIDKILKEEFARGLKKRCGRISYSLKYNLVKESLAVKVAQVEELPRPIDGVLDPYVSVQMKSKSFTNEKRTKIKTKSDMPVFNETFTFKVRSAEFNDSALVFKVYDYDKYGVDSLLGQLCIHLKDITNTSIINELKEFLMDLEQTEDDSSGLGHICVILNSPAQMGLNVTILEAKDLRIKQDSSYSHIFVTVKLKAPNNSNKYKTLAKKRTKDCLYTAFPYFNESFIFQTPPGEVAKCQISIKMWKTGTFKMPICIGYVVLGELGIIGSGEIHWKTMLDNPRHPIAKWHMLTIPGIQKG